MLDRYEPPSAFLKAIIANDVALTGSAEAETNLSRLIELTRDLDRANRDWATLLLSQEGGDTPTVRSALMHAANDEDSIVRAEAVLGLAERDPDGALAFVQQALRGDAISIAILEAAAVCAHPSLIADLRVWTEPSHEPSIDRLAADALAACEQAGG